MTAGQWKLLIARLGLGGQGGVRQPTGQVDGHLAGLVGAWWRWGVTPLSESWSGALCSSPVQEPRWVTCPTLGIFAISAYL